MSKATAKMKARRLEMSRLEKAKWSILLALSDATGDMDEYYLYFLIPLTQYGCDGTDFVLGVVLIAMEVVSLINNPLSGWIVDMTEKYQHITLIFSAVMQLVTAIIFIFIGPRMQVVSLVAVLVAHALFLVLTQTSMWKCVKMRCQLIYGDSDDLQESTMSLIGTHQHIWSNMYELVFLGAAFAVMHFLGDGSFKWAQIIMYSSVILADSAIIIMAFFAVQLTRSAPRLEEVEEEEEKGILGSETNGKGNNRKRIRNGNGIGFGNEEEGGREERYEDDEEEGEEEAYLNPSAALIGVNNSDSTTNSRDNVEWRTLPVGEIISRVFWMGLRGLKEKVLAFWYCRLAVHAILQAWLLYCFTEVMEYPLTFAEANSDGLDCEKAENHCSADNYCGDNLTSLIEVSMLGVLTYVIGAIAYFVFLLPLPPKWFYWVVLPGVSVAMIGVTLSFWFLTHVPHTVSFIFLSIGLVVPTFLERYNFYFWMSVIESKHFGFFYGMYGVGKNVLHICVSLVLALFGKDIKPLSWQFNILLCICLGMMTASFFYSFIFAWLYSDYFKNRETERGKIINDSGAADLPSSPSSSSIGEPSSDTVNDKGDEEIDDDEDGFGGDYDGNVEYRPIIRNTSRT